MIPKLSEASEEDAELLGHLMLKVADVTHKLNIKDNFRVVINNGPMACQTVYRTFTYSKWKNVSLASGDNPPAFRREISNS